MQQDVGDVEPQGRLVEVLDDLAVHLRRDGVRPHPVDDAEEARDDDDHADRCYRAVDRPPSEPVAEHADERDREESEDRGVDDDLGGHRLGEEEVHGEEGDQVGLDHPGVAGLPEAERRGCQEGLDGDPLRRLGDRLGDRVRVAVAGLGQRPVVGLQELLLGRLEDRGLLQVEADVDGQGHDEDGPDEGDAPPPVDELLLGGELNEEEPDEGGEQGSRVRPEGDQRRDDPAPPGRGVLGQHHRGSGDFGAGAEPLDETEEDEQDRREQTDLLIGRQEADEGGRHSHQGDGDVEDFLASDAVAEPSEVPCPDGPGDVSDAVDGHRGHDGDAGVAFGEEELREYEGRGQRIQLEVHELEGRSEPAGHGRFDEVRRRALGKCLLRRRRHLF